MRNIREAGLSAIILAGTVIGSSACDTQEQPKSTPGASFVSAGTIPDHTPTPSVETPEPGYINYISPHGFQIQYPSGMRQNGDSFRGGMQGDFMERIRVITPDSDQKVHTPAITSSRYAKDAQISVSKTTVSGCETIRTELLFTKSTFGTPVEAVTFSITDTAGKHWTVEFAASEKDFKREFPPAKIDKIMSSFKIRK